MNKASKILYIIGIIFAVIIVSITFLSMASERIEGLDFFNRLYLMLNDGYATTDRFAIVLGLTSIVLMFIIILLNSKDKILVIASLVISALILNPFPVAASIVLLIEIHAKNREAYINNPENSDKFYIEDGVVYKKGRRPIIKLNPTTLDLVFLYVGAILSIIFMIAYFFLMCININSVIQHFTPEANGPGAIALLPIYIIIVVIILIVMIIPIIFMAANIVFTLTFISNRRRGMSIIVIILGFLCLTIFNSIAAIKMLERFKKDIEEENNKKDLIA